MSETKHIKGKLVKIALGNLTLEEKCKEISGDVKPEILVAFDNSYANYISVERDEDYYINKDTLYKIVDTRYLDSDDSFFEAEENKDGSISFDTQFYSGGCCLSEALDTAMKPINNKKQEEK